MMGGIPILKMRQMRFYEALLSQVHGLREWSARS